MMHNNSGAMSDDASSGSNGSNGGGGGGNGGVMLKKGPWTAAEDAILIEYVQQHGEGNWNAVQKNSGLSRCGKSCRLRWANHLRPNLKKGSFSPEEERLILELHAKLGNKWARMAAQLPGRTDNEIKNYWNTRVKRRQRAGLPLYPQDIQKHPSSFSFHHHSNNNQHHQSRTSQSSIPLSSSSSSPHPKSNFLTPMTSMFEPVNFSSGTPFLSQPNSSNSYLSLPVQGGFKRFRTNNSFSSFSTQTPPLSSSSLFNSPSFSSLFPSTNFQFDSNTIDFSTPNMLQNSYDSNGLISSGGSTYSVKTELPSNQMLPSSAGLQSGNTKPGPSLTRTNSGLLDALLQEAEEMGGKEHHRQEGLMYKGGALDEFLNCTPHHQGSVFSNNNATPPIGGGSPWDEDSTAQSSGVAVKKEPSLDINNAVEEDDDLSSLLNSIPSAMMVSDLYRRDGAETSNGQSSSVTDEDIGLDARHLPSTTVAATNSSIEPEWSLGAWNDLSGMSC